MTLDDDVRGLVEAYRGPRNGVLSLGRRFLEVRARHGLSQQALARKTGITPGTIHHYESLLSLVPSLISAVESGALTFKEARSIADLPQHRQEQIAEPFISGSLSSVYVERLVRVAKEHPTAELPELFDLLPLRRRAKQRRSVPEASHAGIKESAQQVARRMIDLAAVLTPVASEPYPEVQHMRLRQAALILLNRLEAAKLMPMTVTNGRHSS